VIEHIEDSTAELRRAVDLLAPGGHLLILVPAFNYLYSPFDKAIGHFRRYDKKILKAELPPRPSWSGSIRATSTAWLSSCPS
jgi:hypothetical protein